MGSIAFLSPAFGDDSSRERVLVVVLVVVLHLAVLLVWMAQPKNVPAAEHEMEVTEYIPIEV